MTVTTRNDLQNLKVKVIKVGDTVTSITIVNSIQMNGLNILEQGDGILGILPPLGGTACKLGLLPAQPAPVDELDVGVDAHDGGTVVDGGDADGFGVPAKLELTSRDGVGGVELLDGTAGLDGNGLLSGPALGRRCRVATHVGRPSSGSSCSLGFGVVKGVALPMLKATVGQPPVVAIGRNLLLLLQQLLLRLLRRPLDVVGRFLDSP